MKYAIAGVTFLFYYTCFKTGGLTLLVASVIIVGLNTYTGFKNGQLWPYQEDRYDATQEDNKEP